MAPPPGAQAPGAGEADGVPRDHPRRPSSRRSTIRGRSTRAWSTPRRPAASSTGSTATRCPRCCGGRSTRACRPAGCRARRCAWSSSGSGSAWRSGPPTTGTSRPPSRPTPASRPRSWRSTGGGSPPARTSTTSAGPSATTWSSSTSRRFASWCRSPRARRSRSARTEEKPYTSRPKPPFITSTLQQEGGRKLRMSASQVMRVAQDLYQNGYITYMRTDSTTLSDTALTAARNQVRELYGPDYLPDAPRTYTRKVKNSQEAHEAIRPAGETFRTPDSLAGELRGDSLRLYDMIWKRTVASQMHDARGRTVSVRLAATTTDGRDVEVGASGRTITFPGYLRAYVEGADDPDAELDDRETLLPPLAEGDALPNPDLEAKGHTTSPPARFTEASLIKRLEELGIGRPSTYATIPQTMQDRGYVVKRGTALVPTWTAFAVVQLLEQHFANLVDYAFTARMEDELDEIARKETERVPWLREFWFGQTTGGNGDGLPDVSEGSAGLKALIDQGMEVIDPAQINVVLTMPVEGADDIVVRPGRYGPVPEAGGPHRVDPRRPRARRAHDRQGARAARRAQRRQVPRHRSRQRPRRDRQGRPLRPLRPARRDARGQEGQGGRQAQDGVAVQGHGPRLAGARRRAPAALAAPGRRHRPGRRRRDHRPERPLRAVHQEGQRQPQPRRGEPAVHADPRRGAPDPRPAEAAGPGTGGRTAAARARPGPRLGAAGRREGRTLRLLRDRRRDQRLPAQGRRGRVDHHRAGRRAAAEPARRRADEEEARHQEGPGQEEGGGQEAAPKKKAPAKKAAAKKATNGSDSSD